MSIPKEPRQIMINLMYLVLTAMLALNVSNEILHAFKIINNSIGRSNESIDGKNVETLGSLQGNEDMKGHYDRVHPYNVKAKEVHEKSLEAYKYLEAWKEKIVKESGGYDADKPGEIKREDNIDASTHLLVEEKGGNEVKAKLEEIRTYMLSQINPKEGKEVFAQKFPLQVVAPPKSEDNPSGDWSFGTFHNVPTLAAVTLFSKLQNDVRSSEQIILTELAKEADAGPMKFDAIKAIAVSNTSYVLAGQPVEASILLAAYNTAAVPIITSSNGAVKVEKGVGTWKGTASGTGLQTISGKLSVVLDGRVETQDWKFQYMVGSAGGSVQLDKMNVFYIGVPNPITVTAAGYSLEDVYINIPGATTATTGKGKYDVTVPLSLMGQKVMASIMAKTATGPKEVGKQEIRVKRIPDPIAKVGGKAGTIVMPANVFRAQQGVIAVLEGFDFDTKFTVTSFEFSYFKRGKDYQPLGVVNGPVFRTNAQVGKYMDNLSSIGDQVFLDNIKAKGPDGTTRSLGSIIIKLN